MYVCRSTRPVQTALCELHKIIYTYLTLSDLFLNKRESLFVFGRYGQNLVIRVASLLKIKYLGAWEQPGVLEGVVGFVLVDVRVSIHPTTSMEEQLVLEIAFL